MDEFSEWGKCSSTSLHLGVEPDSMTWTVQVRGDSQASTVRATARFWATASRCVSHGVREAELEALVKEIAERGGLKPSNPPPAGSEGRVGWAFQLEGIAPLKVLVQARVAGDGVKPQRDF
jgi:hypothetical protein